MTNFQLILDALDKYSEQTGINLKENPFADKVLGCDSPASILLLLQENVKEFKKYRDKNRKFIDCLSPVVQFVHVFSDILGEAAGLVPFQPAKLIFVGISVLFTAAEGVSASYDALLELFECIGSFLKRLEIYIKISLSPLMTEIIVKIMAEMVSILSQAKKQVKQGRFKQFAKKLLGDSEIEKIMRRLDRLTQDETHMTEVNILEVVHGLMNNMKVVMEGGEASTSAIRKTLITMQDAVNEMNKMGRDRLNENSRSWLSPPDPSENQVTARRDNHDGSAVWLTRGDTFEKWNANGCLLWIYGKPGSGKSILCSTIIEEAMALRDAGLGLTAFYYFDFRNTAKQDVRGLMSSLLVQLCAKSNPCYEILLRLYSSYDNGSRSPDDKALVNCLKEMLALPDQPAFYLIVDALDECPNTSGVVSQRERVLNLIEDLVELEIENLRICVTSRPEADILDALLPLASHTVSLHDEDGQKHDINNYITSAVRSDRKMRKWRAEDKMLVIDTLSQRADGMFRWVFCQLETLRECYPQALRRTLDKLPETLDATYERTLLGIEKTKREYAYRLFQCLMVSIRPLRVEELAEVLAVLLDTDENSEYHANWRPEDSQQSVLSTCSSLITVANVDGSSVVQFSHFSVKEFLMSSRISNTEETVSRYHILPHSSHNVIARASLSVLLSLGDQVDRSVVENHPLALYASRYWVDHAKFEGVSSGVQDLIERLFDPEKPHFATWVWLYDNDRPWEGHMATARPTQPMAAPLYYASLCGFRNLVKYLATTNPGDVDARAGCYSTALHAAIAKREVPTALELLQHGADKYVLDSRGESPLHNASQRGHLDLVEILLGGGVDVNLRNFVDETPLAVALFRGNIEVAHFLIERGADIHCLNQQGWTPLHTAARHGHLDIVRLLLNLDIDVQVRSRAQDTPLILASDGGYVEVLRLLIEHQADVTSADDEGWTSLHSASRHGHVDVAQLLLDHGADVNVQKADLWSPLHLASAHAHLNVAELLLERGAKVDVRTEDQKTPLDLASGNGNYEVAHLLIKRGSNVNSQDTRGWTPLHSAARNGHLDVVKLLLDSGADIGLRDRSDETAFDLARDNGKRNVVNFLAKRDGSLGSRLGDSELSTPLDKSLDTVSQINFPTISIMEPQPSCDVDEEETDDEQGTSLHSALENDKIAAIKRLLDRGADANERDEYLRTPLYAASKAGKLEIARTLINYGADVNCRNIFGWTPLHTAAQAGQTDVARLLLDNGADVNATQRNHQTPLHLASLNGNLPVVLLLLEGGANVQVRNAHGRTPYQEASSRGYREIVRSLSDYGA
ncbi:Ankyrin repeat-containing domain protein [Lactarius tabidus]